MFSTFYIVLHYCTLFWKHDKIPKDLEVSFRTLNTKSLIKYVISEAFPGPIGLSILAVGRGMTYAEAVTFGRSQLHAELLVLNISQYFHLDPTLGLQTGPHWIGGTVIFTCCLVSIQLFHYTSRYVIWGQLFPSHMWNNCFIDWSMTSVRARKTIETIDRLTVSEL